MARTKKTHPNKIIEWSYPTSTNACRYGFSSTGCWTVELVDDSGLLLPKPLAGYASKSDAIKHLHTLPQAFSRYCSADQLTID